MLLYVLHCGNLYGTERMALATLAGLDEYDERVVFAPPPLGDASVLDAAVDAGYTTVTYRKRRELLRSLRPWFKRYRKVDVIGTGGSEGVFCNLLAKLNFVQLRQLQVAHGGAEDARAYAKKRYMRLVSVRIVAVSDFVRDKLVQHGVRDDAISVIPNFLPSDSGFAVRRSRYAELESVPSRTRVVVVSRVDPIKRIDLLLDAIETGDLDAFQFDVYGTGSELDALRRRAEPLPNVAFHGFVSDVAARLATADVLLHLCPVEPFGLVVLEAFAAKVVCVVPDRGGAGDLVEDERTGFRFRADDRDDLVRTLRKVRRHTTSALDTIVSTAAGALDEEFSPVVGIQRYRAALASAGRPRR